MDSLISRRADVCVVLSGDMQRALVARGVDAASIHIINNFMLESFVDNQFSATQTSISQSDATQITPTINLSVRPANAPFRVVFAGNLGRFQALDALLGAFLDERSQQLPLELHFLGDGVSKAELVTMADGNPSVHFHGHVPFDQAARFMQECDAGIVSIAPGIIHYAYPSKTLSYLGLGVPLFALVEQSSELAIEIDQQNLGIVCQGSSHEALVNGYSRLARWLEQEIDIQVRIEAYARLSSSPKAAADKWKTLLKNIA